MGVLNKIMLWLKKYWYIPVFMVGTVLSWMLFKRSGPPFKQTIAEVKAIQAEAEAKKLKEILGTQKAKEMVVEKYDRELESLDKKQAEQAQEMSDDPAKLAKFLVRASGSNSTH
jgi:hypothetical protein